MSDALTDIRRDEIIASLRRQIWEKEKEFIAEPTAEKAEELLRL